MPNAKITISNSQTGLTRELTADATGRYSVVSIPGGVYTLKVTATGFKTVTIQNVQVAVNEVTRADAKLDVGAVSDAITVEASAAALQTEKADTSSEISQKAVQNLALNQYRNYQQLLNLVPGTTPAGFQNSSTDTPGRALTTNVNGTARNNNGTRLDGAVNVNIWLPHHVAYVAPSETVEQVNISTSSFDAEQGMAGGAAITVISSSGTNQLHGALWDYHENQKLRSQPYFRSSTFVKPRYTLNIFGAKAGGAIVKNKLFWFGHYEGTRQGTGATSQFSLPNAAIKAGDFSAFPTQIFDPATANAEGFGRTPFPGNRIPANRISPQTARILPSIPEPNFPTPNVTANHFVNATGKFDRGNYDAKMNWNRNEKHSVFAKFSLLRANVGGVFAFGPNLGGPGVGGDPG
ncbi:MAG: carboxypeptidase regulatory-like domain-containing protein, partial [Acidobacteriota bacterium]